jgi:pimeloyl-ACP methyl ester carboxylesterase
MPFDAEQLYRACLEDPALGGILSPLRILTFWKMKRRAKVFGESGAARIAREVAQAAPNARIHLMGHSFGCITATAMANVVPAATLTLVQGAMSLWSFAERLPGEPGSGYFRGVLARVPGPIIVTTSAHDYAIGRFYPLAARSGRQVDLDEYPKYGAIGAHGVQGTYAHGHNIGSPGELTRGQVHNVDCSSVIRRIDGIAGAHNDICHPELARLLWRAVLAR